MGRVEGKVALITGAARGQGRAAAVRLAQEGADIVAVDVCAQIDTVGYPLATAEDLAETVRRVQALGRRIVARRADVRDLAALEDAVAEGTARLGPPEIVLANAGIVSGAPAWKISEESWADVVDVNLTGVWKTTRAVIPAMLEAGRGGSIVLTSSIAGLATYANMAAYTAAKHGVTGLMRALAVELAPHFIRCNSVHPAAVDTPMIDQPHGYRVLTGGLRGATREDAARAMLPLNALPIPWVQDVDVANAVLFLASEEARYVTGVALPVDAGGLAPYRLPHGTS